MTLGYDEASLGVAGLSVTTTIDHKAQLAAEKAVRYPSNYSGTKNIFIKSAHGNYFIDHRISDMSLSLVDQPYNPTTGAYNGVLWEIIEAGGGKSIIKSAHGNYYLNHVISDRSLNLADQPYNPSTGAYDGELWEIVMR